jgi:hypothetical protein
MMKIQSFFQTRAAGWFMPILLFLSTLLLIGNTLNDYGVTWDEPPYFHATDLHLQWIIDAQENLARGELRRSLDDESIKAAWHWNPYNVPHPPFSRIVSALGKWLSAGMFDSFSSYRLAPALFFAILVSVTYLWLRELFSPLAGLFSALALVLIPNLFAYAHIAVTDLPLATMWFLTSYCFWKGLNHWRWSVALGVVWGFALATKFPALLIPIPLIIWAHIFHRNRYTNNIFALIFLAPPIMVATQPYLWHQTGLRVLEFFYEGISRGYRAETNFGVFFLNHIMPSKDLPWYYPFYVVAVTTPEAILLLALIGMVAPIWLRPQRATLFLFTLNAFFILIMGLLPGAVLHDGARQMLSALPWIACLSGIGFWLTTNAVVNHLQDWKSIQHTASLRTKVMAVAFSVVCIHPAIELYLTHPFQLSFYNRLVGGIRGAYDRGLEITYFMEAFTPEFIRKLNETLPRNAVVNASSANFMFEFYQKEGLLRPDIQISAGEQFDYYLVLNRRSALSGRDHQILRSAAPVVESVTVAGVPLVALFNTGKAPCSFARSASIKSPSPETQAACAGELMVDQKPSSGLH